MITNIAYKKSKLVSYALLAIVFVVLGIWLLSITNDLFDGFVTQLFFATSCLTIILIFSYIAFLNCYKLVVNEPGLIIGESGIIVNLSTLSPFFINWKEIDEVFYAITSGQTFIMLRIKSPHLFIQKQKGLLRRYVMKINLKTHHAPIALSTKVLHCKSEMLYNMINKMLKK